jgi:DNA-binding transcriptional LysR family regulator
MHSELKHDLAILSEFQVVDTFSAAAARLGVAHTTVSRKVRELEAHFGTRLIERVAERAVLTEAGRRAAATAERIAGELTALERGISGHDGRLAGPIALTTVDILAWRYMPVLAAFAMAHPGIELDISTSVEVRNLSRREAEVALRMTNAPPEHLHGRVVERFDFCAFAAASLPERDLSEHAWLDYEGHECAARAADWMRAQAGGAQPRSYLTTPLVMLFALRQGMGAGLLPAVIGDAEPGLRRLSDVPAFSIDVWLLAPRELRSTARVRALFDAFGRRGPGGGAAA